jgi:hypothetical protein
MIAMTIFIDSHPRLQPGSFTQCGRFPLGGTREARFAGSTGQHHSSPVPVSVQGGMSLDLLENWPMRRFGDWPAFRQRSNERQRQSAVLKF